jgi:catechol 2,3-dioxygenase-like lactoylglutathione lyase family enzyme
LINARLAFVMLGTTDLDRAATFYSELLGLGLTARFGEFAFFGTGATTFALSGELAPADDCSHECVFGVELEPKPKRCR